MTDRKSLEGSDSKCGRGTSFIRGKRPPNVCQGPSTQEDHLEKQEADSIAVYRLYSIEENESQTQTHRGDKHDGMQVETLEMKEEADRRKEKVVEVV